MADTIVSTGSEDNYGFNLEWIAEGSGIGEEICGVDKDCIVVPDSPIMPKIENEDYVEIQVTEEEVIAGRWDDNTECVSELEVVSGFSQDDLVPLDEEQDEYSRLHPYPCDFCSRRFSKHSSLTVHMLTHQNNRQHDCNMCGATYTRKMDLVEHMKIHSYAPMKEEDFEGLCVVDDASFVIKQEKKSPRVRKKKKKPTIAKSTQPIAPSDLDFMDNFPVNIKQEFIDDEYYDQDQRFPVIDPARPYVCQFCGVGFAREKALISHKLIHAGDTTHECDRCTEVFQTAALLQQHIASRHTKATKKSGNCSKKSIKTEVITEGYMCTMCHLVFVTSDELVLHKENHDLGSGVHTCTLCHKDFVLLNDLRSHIKETHGATNVCSHCEHVFKDKYSLAIHLSTYHNVRAATISTCTICNRKFPNKVSLKRHMSTHDTGNNKHKSTTSIQCTECGASEFADGRSLLYHRQTEHGVNMARLFPCIDCGKTFNSRSSQQIHIRIHTGERPYGCHYCWKAFGDGGTLRKHERIHTGEKPYVCPVCTKAFNQRVVLREHIRAHHSGSEGKLSDSCYECMVCSGYFGSPEELCAHLVQHSDENTAKHRTPTARKSNVNRKKKPMSPVVEALRDVSPPRVEYVPVPTPKRKSTKSSSASVNLDAIVKLGKSTLDNLNSIASGKRARIVRSGKKGFNKGQNKRYLNKKEKAKTKLLSNGSYAAKYVVSQPGVEGITIDESRNDANEERDLADSMIAMESYTNGDAEGSVRTRPRTKNVSYHNMRSDHQSFQLATFNDLDMTFMEGEFLVPPSPKKKKSCKKKKKTKRLFDIADAGGSGESEYINGITIDDHLTPEEQIETSIVSEVSDDLEIKSVASDGTSTCQICAEVFFSSEDLFRHIQTHL